MALAVHALHHAWTHPAMAHAAHEGRTEAARRADRLRQGPSAGKQSRDSNGADHQGSLFHVCISNPSQRGPCGPLRALEGEDFTEVFQAPADL
jgi:hypothetical protein